MADELSREELDSLLGAYGLDAVEPDEREQLGEYLARNPAARAEVEETREVMSLLVDLEEGSPALWDRIQDEISQSPGEGSPDPGAPPTPVRRRTSPRRALALVAAAVAALALGSAVVLRENGSGDSSRQAQLRAAVDDARDDPEAREAALADVDGNVRATVVYLPDGTGYVIDAGLEKLPSGQTYQFWAVTDDDTGPAAVSAGVLGRDLEVAAFRFHGPVRGFAISTEDAPGALAPREPLTAEGSLA